MTDQTLQLHFEPRPWTSPCTMCGNAIPNDHTVTLAASDRDAVCDECTLQIDPQAYEALKILRAVDAGWWRAAKQTRQVGPDSDASTFLRNVASGVALLLEFYAGSSS